MLNLQNCGAITTIKTAILIFVFLLCIMPFRPVAGQSPTVPSYMQLIRKFYHNVVEIHRCCRIELYAARPVRG